MNTFDNRNRVVFLPLPFAVPRNATGHGKGRRVNTNPSYSLTVKFIPMNFLLNRERGSTQFCYCCWCCSFTLAVLRNATGHGRERLRCISAFAPASIYVRFLRNITSHHGKRRGLRCCFEYSFYLYLRTQERI